MERLTERSPKLPDGSEYFAVNGTYGELCETICHERGNCKGCPIQEAFNKLAAYEDTGMQPEEIMARGKKIKQMFRDCIKEQREVFVKGTIAVDLVEDVIVEFYSQIFGVTYNEAAKELHGGNDNEKT